MTKFIILLTVFFVFVSCGQQKTNDKIQNHLTTIEDINKICTTIDHDKNLGESIKEGEILNYKGGFDIYYLHDGHNKILYRVTDNISTDRYSSTIIFYYNKNCVIKAIVRNYNTLTKKEYNAIYYFNNNKLICRINENTNYSKSNDILKQGLDNQKQFYIDKEK